MNCHWEELTVGDFAQAVKDVGGVCVVPLGCLEKHGPHLPLGTDVFVARKVTELAVQQEPAIIFPPHFIGWIHDGKHHPGAVALRPELLLEMLENMCEEIARNGLTKIILVNGHGGNEPMLNYFVWKGMAEKRSFQLYYARLRDYYWAESDSEILETGHGHAGEGETSSVLATRPDLVQMDKATSAGEARGRLAHLPPMSTGWEWHADWPDHHAGDSTLGTAEKGEKLLARMAPRLAAIIKAVREDNAVQTLQDEFFSRIDHSREPLDKH